MEVLGRDPGREAYRVAITAAPGRVTTAWVPEALMAPTRLSHEAAYEWIAGRKKQIEQAVLAMSNGTRVKAPFDTIELAEDQ